jgi:hypothetical protein
VRSLARRRARAKDLDGGADAVGIFRRDGDNFAIELETFFGDRRGKEPEGISGNGREKPGSQGGDFGGKVRI